MPNARRSPEDIRQAIVDAAIERIGGHGIDGLTHRSVAAGADVSLSSTTYHFASKEAIVAAALRQVLEENLARLARDIDTLTAARTSGTAVSATSLVETLLGEITHSNPVRLRAQYHLLLEAAEHTELQPVVVAWSEEVLRRIVTLLETLGSSRPELDAQLLVAATDGLRLSALMLLSSARVEALRAALERLIHLITELPD